MRVLWVAPVAVAIGAVLLSAPLVVAQLGLDHSTRFVPSSTDLFRILWLCAIAAPLIHGLVLVTLARRALGSLHRRSRVLYVVSTTVLHIGVGTAALAIGFSTDPHAFGGDLIAEAPSPDRRLTAYLYAGGLVCGYDVFVASRGERRMRQVKSIAMDCREQAAALVVWNDAGYLEITSERGRLTPPFPATSSE